MPLITASHFFAFSAGIRPGNAVFDATSRSRPRSAASFAAMSTSKPMILPLVVAYSIGGNVGSVQYLNVAGVTARARRSARRATASQQATSRTTMLAHVSPPCDPEGETLDRIRRTRPAPAARASPPDRSSGRSATPGRDRRRRPPRASPAPGGRTRPGSPGRSVPCAIAIGGNGGSRSGSQPSTVGMKPLIAISARGRGRPSPSAERVAHDRALREAAEHDRSAGNGSASNQSVSAP